MVRPCKKCERKQMAKECQESQDSVRKGRPKEEWIKQVLADIRERSLEDNQQKIKLRMREQLIVFIAELRLAVTEYSTITKYYKYLPSNLTF